MEQVTYIVECNGDWFRALTEDDVIMTIKVFGSTCPLESMMVTETIEVTKSVNDWAKVRNINLEQFHVQSRG